MKPIYRLPSLTAILSMLVVVFGCKIEGGTNGDGCEGCVGAGKVVAGTGGKVEISLEDEDSGSENIIVPFVLGDLTKTLGASAGDAGKTLIAYSEESQSTGVATLIPSQRTVRVSNSIESHQHNLRTLWNRFERRRGVDQAQGFWSYVGRLEDEQTRLNLATHDSLQGGIERRLRNRIATFAVNDRRTARPRTHLVDSACPDEIYMPGGDEPVGENYYTAYDKTSFCLIVVKDGSLISEPSIEKIQDSVATALTTYKLVYEDSFDASRDHYLFQPLIITVPMDDAEFWPQDPEYKIQGAFFADQTDLHGRPTIYVAADLKVVGTDEELENESFHSLIAHEMSHAIVNYYRSWVPDSPQDEVPSIDEGIAHFMEDLLGYGELNFKLFPKPFLASFEVAPEPVLWDNSLTNLSDSSRGAAQTLIYYFVSQTGGVEFLDGTVNRQAGVSSGLNWIAKYLMQSKLGPAGLSVAVGGDWLQMLGGYFGALAVDGADQFKVSSIFSVMDPVNEVIDTSGTPNKTFGMHFNNYEGLATVAESADSMPELSNTGTQLEKNLKYYQPQPLRYQTSEDDQSVVISFNDEVLNAGAVVVRIR